MKEKNMKLMKSSVALIITLALVVSSLPGFAQGSEIRPLDVSVLNEGFEAGVMPPAGWTKTTTQATATWQIATDQAHTGTRSALVPMSNKKQDEKQKKPYRETEKLPDQNNNDKQTENDCPYWNRK